jgi:hypothetical protein
MIYAQFFVPAHFEPAPGKVISLLGSDGVHRLDARISAWRRHDAAKKRIKALKNVQPHIVAYQLMRGEKYSTAKPISEIQFVTEPEEVHNDWVYTASGYEVLDSDGVMVAKVNPDTSTRGFAKHICNCVNRYDQLVELLTVLSNPIGDRFSATCQAQELLKTVHDERKN